MPNPPTLALHDRCQQRSRVVPLLRGAPCRHKSHGSLRWWGWVLYAVLSAARLVRAAANRAFPVNRTSDVQVLFRPVAVMTPDFRMIAEVILFSEGYKAARPLSLKITQLFKLSSEQLSPQVWSAARGLPLRTQRPAHSEACSPRPPVAPASQHCIPVARACRVWVRGGCRTGPPNRLRQVLCWCQPTATRCGPWPNSGGQVPLSGRHRSRWLASKSVTSHPLSDDGHFFVSRSVTVSAGRRSEGLRPRSGERPGGAHTRFTGQLPRVNNCISRLCTHLLGDPPPPGANTQIG